MDPFSFAAGLVQSVEASLKIIQNACQLQSYDRYTISQLYGPTAGFLISTCFPSTASEYERIQRVVLRGSDEETLRFRAAVTNECNMTAVAVCLICGT